MGHQRVMQIIQIMGRQIRKEFMDCVKEFYMKVCVLIIMCQD